MNSVAGGTHKRSGVNPVNNENAANTQKLEQRAHVAAPLIQLGKTGDKAFLILSVILA